MEYIPFTPEQVEQANHVDLEEFLLQHGEKLLRSGPEKRLASNRSVTIRGNEWFDHADRQGGQAVSFVQRYLDVPFQEAMQILLGEQGVVYSPAQEKKEEPPKPFVLPPAHTDNRRMRAYLEHTRKISGEVLTIFEKEGLIYEDSLYHNAVFVGLDDQGVARHAHKRSTNTQGKQFKINVEGCNARHSIHWTGSSHRIYVFEAPIDMLSFISMKPDWQQHSYVALCGVAEHALLQQLEAHEQLSDVVLCLDNDDAGIQARKRIKDILQKRGHSQVSSLLPSSKDWNEDLQRGVVMTEKVREYLTLSRETTVAMTQDQEKWQAFLRTAGQMYKYSFNDQVLIFAQRPEATACAGYDVWNKTMRRYVKKGAKGIALLDAQDKHLKLHYIFDVADTSEWKNSRQVYVWQMKDTQLPAVQQALAGAFGVPVNLGSLQEQMTGIVSILWMNRWTQQKDDILDNIDQSFKKEYDEFTIQEMFRKAVVPSVVGAVCSRCGVQAPTISAEEFENISEFKTPKMVNALGNMVTEFSNEALRVVERTVKRLEKDERSKQHGDPVQTSGRGSDPRPGADGHEHYTHPAVGTDAPGVSDGTQVMHLLNHGDGADPVSPPAGDRPGSTGENGQADAPVGQGGGSHGRAEEEGPHEVGGPDEHLQGSSGGDYPGGTDLQLSLFPTEAEQIQIIEEAERVADTFSAFSFAQADIDHVLRLGGNTYRQREYIVAAFEEQKSTAKIAAYLQTLYSGGNGVGRVTVWYAEDGIHLSHGKSARYDKSAQVISWESAAERIDQLLQGGQFATGVELAEAEGYERTRLAEKLWHLYHDFSNEAREAGYLSCLADNPQRGFPEQSAWLAEQLKSPEFRQSLMEEYSVFWKALDQDQKLLRFHYHKLREIWENLKDLSLPRTTFTSQLTEVPAVNQFITEDEIDVALAHGSNMAGGKERIFAFFQESHTDKEKADFLKHEYGIGGHSHALSGAYGSDESHDGKGIRYKKTGCPEVYITWEKVARRITGLVQKGCYLTEQEQAQYEKIQAEKNLAERETIAEPTIRYAQINEGDQALIEEALPIPFVEGYAALKAQHYDAVVGVEVGKYVIFLGEDAQIAAKALGTKILSVDIPGMGITDMTGSNLGWPSVLKRLMGQNLSIVLAQQDPEGGPEAPYEIIKERYAGEYDLRTDEEYAQDELVPGETTVEMDGRTFQVSKLELDIGRVEPISVVQDHLEFKPTLQKTLDEVLDEHPVSIQVNGEWQTFPSVKAAEEASYQEYKANLRRTAKNFRITDDHLGEGGPKAKFQANVDAIKLLIYLEETTGQATPEQQEILSRYVGWGGLSDAFDPSKENWSKEYKQLKELLTPEEYTAARGSTLNAHYTSPTIIRAIYEAVSRMGFESGNILEPSCGVGNFFGMLPESMAGSKLYGVELDPISGRIAQQLYPKADITVAGFESTDRRDFYDLAIGNVPFGQYQVNDKAYNKLKFNIHNYFFAKALDQVRSGGVVAFVTSRYTMDAKDSTVRRYLAQRAELLGAIRLPNNAFKANAGAEVVSDIIFLQKRERPLDITPDWTQVGQNQEGYTINQYFVDHPNMVLGREEMQSSAHGMAYTVSPLEEADLAQQLQEAVGHIGGTYEPVEQPDLAEEGMGVGDTIPADPTVKNFSYTLVDGLLYYRENSIMVRPGLTATGESRAKELVGLRQCVQQLIDMQMDATISDADIQDKQDELNRLYDRFAAKYGLINDRANRLTFANDSSYYLLCALEEVDEDGKLIRKADMFTKRTIKPHQAVLSVDTASEALAVSIAEKACVDMPYMEQLTGKSEKELARELKGVVFRLPGTTAQNQRAHYETADAYLSGNVRVKLREARQAAEANPAYSVNVEALEKAQPKDLDASEIEVRLGATWIDKEYFQQFMYETFDTPHYMRSSLKVNYSPFTAEWQITHKSYISGNDIAAYTTYGTDRASAYKILEESLNLRDIRIYDKVEDPGGKERRVLNSRETTLAQQKQQAIRDAFRDWIWQDPERRQALVRQYNEEMNAIRPREYDGSHINFGGMNPEITLREHQKNAIAHVLYGGNTLLAHEVGAGKTFEMVAAAMESKRLGLCQKSLFVVPNHLTGQWASEFLRLYPAANILVTTKKDFEPANRKRFCARIATGDYDAIIMGHSQFEKIPISLERQEQLIQEQIDEITEGIAQVKESGGEQFSIKQLERTRKILETKLDKLRADERKDDVVTFEQLGVDRLFVDEAHMYKNLFLFTKMRNVAGLSTSDAQKSSDMFAKCRYMDEITGSRGVVFATGTPVSNSMTELYTMQRYLQYDRLQELNMVHFDCWASRFGETVSAMELAPEGTGYRVRTRFSKFYNLPELMNLFKEVADIKTADQLHLPTPEVEFHNVVAQPTEHQKQMVKALSERAAKVHSGSVDSSIDNMLKITSDGRKLGLDQRIINPSLPDEPGSKVNRCVDDIFQIWEDTQADKLTQLVFCDISTQKTKRRKGEDPEFTVYEDIRQKLTARGVPKQEIAFIHDANTDAKKKELFGKVRSGQVRVLLGSTSKMGAGTNVQDRLIALHDLDCPWRPGDLEQRKGRIVRQGNQNQKVHVYRYVTEGTFDAYLWQTVENKQRFISQIMTSKSPVRSCDDVDETALSFAEIKALCAGDPRIKERMDLDVDVARLRLMKADHQSKQYRLEDQVLTYFPRTIEENKGYIRGFQTDMQVLEQHPHPQDGFAGMEVMGRCYTDKEKAGQALLDACRVTPGGEPVSVGRYRGFDMSVSMNAFSTEYQLTLHHHMTHLITLGPDARGNILRIDHALEQMGKRLHAVKMKLEDIYRQLAAAQEELGKPFPQEEELRAKTDRLIELDAQLNMEKGQPEQQDGQKPSVKEKRGKER